MQMFDSMVERFTGFMGATENYDEADIAIVGIPMDFTVSFRPGTRMGPQQIRTVSYGIEEYSVYLDKDLADKSYFDLGDMNLPFGNVEGSLTVIENVTRRMLADKKFPILLGGEHLVTYPIIRAFKEQYQDLVVIHFDAHADLRLDYAGEPNSHATVMRKVAQMIEPKNLYQFGIRSGTSDEFQYAKENTNMFIDRVIEPLKQVIPTLGQRPVYVSLDIDVVDPAYAPGTGTPEAGGCSSREIIEAIHELGAANIVGFDLVEVSPATDQSERTSLLAAKIIREAILAFC
jgi:agmatinase